MSNHRILRRFGMRIKNDVAWGHRGMKIRVLERGKIMVNLDKEKQELMEEIKLLGYESLRYSVFNEHGLSEWETRIEFNNETEKYEVYLTRDRAEKGKIFEYTNFKEAKEKFMELLEHTVSRNKYYISNGWAPQYPSPSGMMPQSSK